MSVNIICPSSNNTVSSRNGSCTLVFEYSQTTGSTTGSTVVLVEVAMVTVVIWISLDRIDELAWLGDEVLCPDAIWKKFCNFGQNELKISACEIFYVA